MALSDVLKKKQAAEAGTEKKKDKKINLVDDIRVFIGLMALACIALIVATVFSAKSIETTLTSIDEAKAEYQENQASIANLHALQSKSDEYKAQRDEYNAMISSEKLDQQQIMIDMETDVESHNCTLNDIAFEEATNTGLLNQISVTLSVQGKYSDIMSFCYDTVNGEQIKRIDTINMTDEGTENVKKAEIVVVLFSK